MSGRSVLTDRRLELGLSIAQVSKRAREKGFTLARPTIQLMEDGAPVLELTAARLLIVLEVPRERWHEFFPDHFDEIGASA